MTRYRLLVITLVIGISLLSAGRGSGGVSASPATGAAVQPEAIRELGHIGGAASAVDGQPGRAYLGWGAFLEILDVSNPALPASLGRSTPMSGTVTAVAVSGNLAYVGANNAGLYVFDVSNPAAPVQLGHHATASYVTDVAVSGTYVYLTDNDSGLRILDASNPAAMVEVGWYNPARAASFVDLSGQYAYVVQRDSDGFGFVDIIDISYPGAPNLVGFYWAASIWDLAVAGQYVYLVDSGRLRILDVSDPPAPVQVGTYGNPSTVSVQRVAVTGSIAYITADTSPLPSAPVDLQVLDVSNVTLPALIGSIPNAFSGPAMIDVSGNTVLAPTRDEGLCLADVTNPANPALGGLYVTAPIARDVAVVNQRAYVVDGADGLHILDTSDPGHMQRLGAYLDSGGWQMNFQRVVVSGTRAYMNNSGLMRIIDVTNPVSPTLLGSYSAPTFFLKGITLAGLFAYLPYETYVRIVDVSNPANPVMVGEYNAGTGSAEGLVVRGQYAYVAYGNDGLRILNISDPAHVVSVGQWNPPTGDFKGITLEGSLAYLVDGAQLAVVDVATPASPALVGSISVPEAADVRAAGGFAYVTLRDSGMHLIDARNPAAPVVIASYDLPGYLSGYPYGQYGFRFELSQMKAFVANGNAGLYVLEGELPLLPPRLYLPLALR